MKRLRPQVDHSRFAALPDSLRFPIRFAHCPSAGPSAFPWLRSAGPWHFPSAGSCGIGFDEDYRLVLSRTIREHVPSESLREYFLNREGDTLEAPTRFRPLPEYLEAHRQGGDF
jgi:hypothetical protein